MFSYLLFLRAIVLIQARELYAENQRLRTVKHALQAQNTALETDLKENAMKGHAATAQVAALQEQLATEKEKASSLRTPAADGTVQVTNQ